MKKEPTPEAIKLVMDGIEWDYYGADNIEQARTPREQRIDRAVLSALSSVDYVVGFEDATPESLIRKIKPDVLVKGEDWADKGVVGSEFV